MNANSRETDDSFFKLVSVSEICKISLGGTPKTDIKDFWGGPVKWATAKDIVNNQGRYITSTERTISLSGVDNSNAKIFPKGTIVVTSRGTVGVISILGIPMSFNQTCYGLSTDDKVNSLFLYYALRNSIEKMLSLSYGTVFQTITIKTFQELKIPLPTIEEQQAIAKILSDLDEKMELNNQMNKTLEDIAQAIFKRWFIDFEFPNENGEPYKSSGGEMVESELGMIPKGWEIGQIYSLADVLYGAPLSSGLFNTSERGIPIIRIRDLEKQNPNTYTTEKVDKKYLVRPGEILVGMDGEFRVYIWRHFEALLNQRICKFIPKNDVSNVFLFFSLQEPMNFFERSKVGTTVIHLGKTDIDQMRFFLPPEKIMSEFKNALDVIFNKIVLSSLESKNLSKIRDLLLPKLMTGKIRVPLEGQNVE